MNKRIYVIPPPTLKGTFFYKKNCYLKIARTFKVMRNPLYDEYLFSGPQKILFMNKEDSMVWYSYWEKRLKKEKISPELREKAQHLFDCLRESRSLSSMKKYYTFTSQGKYHDLKYHFKNVCRSFLPEFKGSVYLCWSRRNCRTYLGKYITGNSVIVINRLLDTPLSPGYILDYVLYHELLHHVLGLDFSEANYRHTSEFNSHLHKFPQAHIVRREIETLMNSLLKEDKLALQ